MAVQTFGSYLRNISLSIDIVNDETFKRVKGEMEDYFEKLDIKFFEFLVPENIEDVAGLTTVWHSGGKTWNKRLRFDDGSYQGHISYSFDLGYKMCVQAKDGGRLSLAKSFVDNWEGKREEVSLPKYVNLSKKPTYASIMIPTTDPSETKIGIFNFEFGPEIQITSRLREELELLSVAFANIYVLHKANITQRDNTSKVLKSLGKHNGFTMDFKKPFIFVASSSVADENVKKSIENVLTRYDEKVTTKYWYASHKSGSIPEEIQKYISECTYGVCYLSEKAAEGYDSEYRDNPNVLFEAGMIHALKGADRWIPIREEKERTDPFPFDIQSLRHVLVTRGENGEFDNETFQSDLEKQLRSLWSDSD